MAVLAVAAVGAAAGAGVSLATGGIALSTAVGIGWAVGSVVGNMFFGPKPEGPENTFSEGPRLNSLIMRGGSFAADIPETWGSVRLGTTVIWKLPLHEEKVTTTTVIEGPDGGKGGKGGGGGSATHTTVSYEYYASFAVLVCEGPAYVGKLWLNSVLARGGGVTNPIDEFITIYDGSEDQLPDPTMEAAEGVGNVPAYRGSTIIVFNRLPLKDFGYSLPNVEAEIGKAPENFCGVQGTSDYKILPPKETTWEYYWFVEERGDDPAKDYIHESTMRRVQIGASGSYEYYPGYKVVDTDRNIVREQITPTTEYIGSWSSNFNGGLCEGGEFSVWANWSSIYSVPNNFFSYGTVTIPVADRPANDRGRTTWTAKIPNLEITDGFVWLSGYNYQVSSLGVRLHLVQVVRDADGNGINFLPIKTFTMREEDQPGSPMLQNAWLQRDDFNRWWITWQAGALSHQIYAQRITFDLDTDEVVVLNTFILEDITNNLSRYKSITFGLDCMFWQATEWQRYSSELDFDTDTISNSRKIADNTSGFHHIWSSGRYALTTAAGEPYPLKILEGNFSDGNLDEVSVGDIIYELCLEAGLEPSQIDVSAIDDKVVGYIRPGTMVLRDAIAPLLSTFMINAVESDGKIRFVSNIDETTQTNITVLEDDMGAHPYGAEAGEVLTLRRIQEMETPREVRVIFSDRMQDYDVNVHRAVNPISTSDSTIDIESPMVLKAQAAKTIAFNFLNGSQTDRVSANFSLMPNHMGFEPGDILKLETHRGTLQVRLSRAALSPVGVVSCEGVLYNGDSYLNNPDVDEAAGPAELPTIQPSDVILLDIPMLRSIDADVTGVYAVGFPTVTSDFAWPGADLYIQAGGGWLLGTYWSEGKVATKGIVLEPVLDVAQPWNWDDGSALVVTSNLPLASSTEEDVLAGANRACIGEHGRWEVIGFVNVEDLGDGEYKLTRLLRGCVGTEHNTGTSIATDTFVLLDSVGVRRSALPSAATGTSVNWRMVAVNDRIQYTSDIPFTSENVGDMPLAPVNIVGNRNTDASLVVRWTRRSRCAITADMGTEYPICETEERYVVEFRTTLGPAVLRSVEVVDATELLYSLPAYSADVGNQDLTSIPDIHVTVYQISSTVGRGYPGVNIV